MLFRRSLILLFIGLILGIAVNYLTGPSIETFGTDFLPPAPETTSLRISGMYSDGTDYSLIDTEMERFMSNWEITGASLSLARDRKSVV